jgi:ATP-binding cassette, subfamily C, bacterial LapB
MATDEFLEGAQVPASRTGTAGHPIAGLRRLAIRLGGAGDAQLTGMTDAPGMPGPQLLQDISDRFGIDIALVSMNMLTLRPADCPCVALMSDGTSRLILDAPVGGALSVAGDGGAAVQVDRRILAVMASGGGFRGRKRLLEEKTLKLTPVMAAASLPPGVSSGGQSLGNRLVALAFAQRGLVLALAIAGFVSGLINLAVPLFTMVVFDRVIPHGAFETLWALLAGVTLLLVVDLALRHVRHKLGDAIAIQGSTTLGSLFYSRLLQAPLSLLPSHPAHLIQPSQEMNQATHLAPQFAAGLMVDIPFFIVVTLLLASLGGWIAVIPVVGVAILLAANAFAHISALRNAGDDSRLTQRQQQMVIDAVAGAEHLRATAAAPGLLMQWEERSDAAAMTGHRLRSIHSFVTHFSAIVFQFVTVATVAAGAYAINTSQMTVGALSACMMLAGRAAIPVAQLMAQGFRLHQLMRTTAPVAAFMDADIEQGGDQTSAAPRVIAGQYQLSGISFAHRGSERQILQDLSLTIKAGERIGVIGRSGCGKSTLLKLLSGLYTPAKGSIHIDSRDIRQVDPLSLRLAVSLMPQTPHLFDSSLADNLTAGLGSVDPDWLQHVAALAGVNDLAKAHPAGFSLPVGPGGQALSGGERQSAALARAIMGKPRMLLLDEPTAAMDNERETRIVQSLQKELTAGELQQTGLIIATHRLPMLALVDRVIWLDRGKIIADGPKDEIFRKFGLAA